LRGSSPQYPLSRRTTRSQTQNDATFPLTLQLLPKTIIRLIITVAMGITIFI
jgi:hypothetical protein